MDKKISIITENFIYSLPYFELNYNKNWHNGSENLGLEGIIIILFAMVPFPCLERPWVRKFRKLNRMGHRNKTWPPVFLISENIFCGS